MIHDVDEGIRAVIRHALNGADVEVVFDAPTKDWAARRNAPTLDVYLYDIREDMKWRAYGQVDLKANGLTVGRQGPPRYYKLSYMITAWTQRPEDEHRLLSACLYAFSREEALPRELLPASLAEQGAPIRTFIALPPPQDRSISDVWSALGGELKPSLDLICLLPIDITGEIPVAGLVTEQPRFAMAGPDGAGEEAPRRRPRRGARVGVRTDEAAAEEGDGEEDGATEPYQPIEETIWGSAEVKDGKRSVEGRERMQDPGRIFWLREIDGDGG